MPDTISVIIPAYNERESIPDILNLIVRQVRPLEEIIVVEDGSLDMTAQAVSVLAEENPKIRLISRLSRRGIVSAIWEGILNSKGDWVLWLDADFSDSALSLTRLIEAKTSCDIALFSRYVPAGGDRREENLRVMASRVFNCLARFLLGTKTADLTSGYCLARREIFKDIILDGVHGEYFVRFIYQAEKKGLRIKEIPYVYYSRKKGKSKTSGNIFVFMMYCWIYLWEILRIKFNLSLRGIPTNVGMTKQSPV